MTEILFYHLQGMSLESVLPPLLEKSIERGWRVVVQSTSPERTEALDAHLWTYSDDLFLPHATWRAGDAPDQPIILSIEDGNPNRANVRFLIDNAALPADCENYERIVLVFNGDDDDALAAARSTWTDCKTRGFELTYWQTDGSPAPGDIVTSSRADHRDHQHRRRRPLVLADVLWYVRRSQAEFMVDLATLPARSWWRSAPIRRHVLQQRRTGGAAGKIGTNRRARLAHAARPRIRQADRFAVRRHEEHRRASTAARSPPRSSCSVSSTTRRGRISTSRALRWAPETDINHSWGSGYGVRLLERLVAEYYEAAK